MSTEHGCHSTRHDAARHARDQSANRRDGRVWVVDRCPCTRGWITTPFGAAVRARRAAARRARRARVRAQGRRWAA